MAKRLTEEMVIARTKISDLSKIKRLNCWGSELGDVSLLRKMPCVEVLSLSINKINTLVDVQFCKRLEELYIRQNDIRDLNEVVYLQNLPNLKSLWLGENPCANVEGYRMSVIKALPQLQKLDNVAVTPEEVRDSQKRGRSLSHPEDPQESEEEYVAPQPQYNNRYQEYSESEYSPSQRVSPRQEVSPPRRAEPVQRNYSPEPSEYNRRRDSYERESSPKQNQYYEEYTNGDRYVPSHNFRNSADDRSDVASQPGHEKRCPAAFRHPFNQRRPVTRNSNILSAVLCLVKELDYPSLEVVEMAVRCRMDELDE
ncbi:unnamed protein product [Brassicogethes aeneus]|uniref:U2A'/phosphoprotein 32 family A C-terminal domain-containing protein n=1 Tax=Brassicogethes aeneus TaxID=1431903 RepID=A0A9P0AWV7_BRAAE|nr:unnamed protein product [Brassicogethes aeneus]